jgi:hypothetical protein
MVRQREKLEGLPCVTPNDERNARIAWFESARSFASNLRVAVHNGGATQEQVDSLLKAENPHHRAPEGLSKHNDNKHLFEGGPSCGRPARTPGYCLDL